MIKADGVQQILINNKNPHTDLVYAVSRSNKHSDDKHKLFNVTSLIQE